MSRVFLFEETDFDTRSALEHGDFVYVFQDTIRPSIWSTRIFEQQFLERIRLLQFDKRRDKFLMLGTAVPNILITSFLIKEFEWFDALLFSSTTRSYVLRTLGNTGLR